MANLMAPIAPQQHTYTEAEVKQLNEQLFDMLDNGHEKTATDAVNDYTRTKMREDGFYRRVMEPIPINNDDLDRQVDSEDPVKVVDKEPDSPAAATIPFATLPFNVYILGNRYRVMFCRIVTPRFVKDVDQLRTWIMDIRQVLSDNSIKDMLAEEDSKFIAACNALMIGPDQLVPYNGNAVNWETIEGGIARETWEEARKTMPKGPAHLEATTCLMNNVTVKEFEKWGRDEMGGDFSQDVLKNGWAETTLSRVRILITIKRDLVPDDSIFMFADQKFLGKNYQLEDTTMYLKREAYMIEFFSYQSQGGSLGTAGGVTRNDFI